MSATVAQPHTKGQRAGKEKRSAGRENGNAAGKLDAANNNHPAATATGDNHHQQTPPHKEKVPLVSVVSVRPLVTRRLASVER